MKIKKKLLAFALAMTMVIQTILPVASFAKESRPSQKGNLVKIGVLDASSLMPLNGKTMQQINRLTRNAQKSQPVEKGTQLFSNPWFPNQRDPEDKDKPLYFGKVHVNLKTKGLTQQDGTQLPFDWEGVFGRDEEGELNKVKVVFVQLNYREGTFSTETGIKGILETDSAGKHYWSDENGDPIKLPLYSRDFKPYKYEVYLERSNSDRVNLLLDGSFGTPNFSFAKPDPVTGEIVANVSMDNTLIQIASTKFVSEWNTDTSEDDRPTVEFAYNTHRKGDDGEVIEGYFEFPKNNTDVEIIRDENGDDGKYPSIFLEKVPTVDVADPDPESNDTYSLDRDNKKISYKGRTYKYTFNYDVINGGKLTMTEILNIKFDANGGKFDSIDEGQKQVKENEVVYTKDLPEPIEEPKKDYETFLGWGVKDDKGEFIKDTRGNIFLVGKSVFKNIKESQTYYAIWDKHAVSAKQLVVNESFYDEVNKKYINDFIPDFEELREYVKINNEKGEPQALDTTDKLTILDGTNEYKADGEELKKYLYEQLKEDENTEVSKDVILKAKVTHKNGETQDVEIPIKVIKNIYEAKTLSEKPYYVPKDYVKVTLDPTPMAKDPQKTHYYVNPKAKVVIPGEDPEGSGDNKFIKWTMKEDTATGDGTEYKLKDKPRTQFEKASTITAQYISDVIPQTGNNKPDHVPGNYVKVKFDPTDKAKDAKEKIFWVNPDKAVTIPVDDPVGKDGASFNEWKIGDVATGETYKTGSTKQFTEKLTTITATYLQDVIPKINDKGQVNTKPDGFVEVKFVAGPNGKLKKGETEIQEVVFFVNPEKYVSLNPPTDLAKGNTGYEFGSWSPDVTNYLKFTQNTTIKANFNEQGAVIPKVDEDTKQPDGYKTVTFVIDPAEGGQINNKEITTYFVNPNKKVSITPPKTTADTGYKFNQWDQDTTTPKQYADDTTVKGSFTNISDIIPATDVGGKPEGYVTVTFKADDTGSLSGDTVFYVNSKKELDLEPTANSIGKNPNAGYTAKGGTWDVDENKKFRDTFTADNTTFTFSFKKLADPSRIQMRDGDILTTPMEVFAGDKIEDSAYKKYLGLDSSDTRKIDHITVTTKADTTSPGITSALITVTFDDNTTADTKVLVFVKERCKQCPDPGQCPNPNYPPTPDPNPTPTPDPIVPGIGDDSEDGDDDKEKEPEDKEETPDEEKDKEKDKDNDPDKEKEDNPDEVKDSEKDKKKTQEKPGEKDSKKPGQNQPPVKNDGKKNPGQTGTKIVKTINQTGTKVINNVKNFLNPTTGIITNYGLYIGLMAASSVGLFFARDKKNEDDDEE